MATELVTASAGGEGEDAVGDDGDDDNENDGEVKCETGRERLAFVVVSLVDTDASSVRTRFNDVLAASSVLLLLGGIVSVDRTH